MPRIQRSWLHLVVVLSMGCKRSPSDYAASIAHVDGTRIVFEFRAPSGTRVSDRQISPGGRETVDGALRSEYAWRWLSQPLASPMCFEFRPRWPYPPTRRCIPLPYADSEMRRIPPPGQFAVISQRDERSLLVAAPQARSLTVDGAPVVLDRFGVGVATVDLRARFFSTPRPSPNDWQMVSLPVSVDGASRDTQIQVDGAQWVVAALERPIPPSTTLDGVLLRRANGAFERRSGASTLPRLYVTESVSETRAGSCYGRRKIAVHRAFVVRDTRTGATHSQRTFSPRDLAVCPREYVIDLNDRRPRMYEPEESEVQRWLDGLRAN